MLLRGIFRAAFLAAFLAPPGLAQVIDAEEGRAMAAISAARLRESVEFLASDELAGRIPGSEGHGRARDWLVERLGEIGLEPAGTASYTQEFADRAHPKRLQREPDGSVAKNREHLGVNVIGLLRGTDETLSHECLVYVAHYDHLGVTESGDPFNGAFDNAGGVAVGLEVARALKEAGAAPRRSILFLFSDGEEEGLRGARAWLESPTVPLENVVLAISGDPLGRRLLDDYGLILLSGFERSPRLLEFWRGMDSFAESQVAYAHRASIPFFASDQDCFHEKGIPAAWFVNPGMTFYHQTTDDASTIDYGLLRDDARYLARCLLAVGNTAERFAYEGPLPMGADTARDARRITEAILASAVPTAEEKVMAAGIQGELDKVIEKGSFAALGDSEQFFKGVVVFLFQLTKSHPGPIPPPFPADDPAVPDEER